MVSPPCPSDTQQLHTKGYTLPIGANYLLLELYALDVKLRLYIHNQDGDISYYRIKMFHITPSRFTKLTAVPVFAWDLLNQLMNTPCGVGPIPL